MPRFQVSLDDGREFEMTADRQPTMEEAKQAVSGQLQQPQLPSFFSPEKIAMEKPKSSPISNIDRIKLSFADDRGRERFLKERFSIVERLPNGKFAVGNSTDDIRPIDPEGLFNDVLGDIADIVGEIPVIVGQVAGTIIGGGATAGFVPAAIAGAGIGAASGEAMKQAIGKSLGVSDSKAEEIIGNVALSAAFGATGEGIAQGLGMLGRNVIKPAVAKMFDKGIKSSGNPGVTLNAMSKLFKVTAGVDIVDTIDAGTYGFGKTLNPKYKNSGFLRTITSEFADGMIKYNDDVGKAVGVGDDWAIKNFGSKKIELRQAGHDLLNVLSSDRVGMIDSAGRLNKAAFQEAGDFRAIKEITEMFFGRNPRTGQLLPKNLSVKQAIDFKKRANNRLKAFFKSPRNNPDVERGIAQYFNEVTGGITDNVLPKGLNRQMMITLPQAQQEAIISQNPFLKANRAFRTWKQDLNLLKKNGLDVEDITDLKKLFRGDKIVSAKLDDFMVRVQNKSGSTQEAFQIVAGKINKKFPGGGINNTVGTLYDELRKFNAAQGFASSNPDFLRLGAIATLIGVSEMVDPSSPEGKLLKIGAGLAVGTPAGISLLLRTGSAGKQALKSLVQQGGKQEFGRTELLKRLNIAIATQTAKSRVKQ